jgi:hypothetical protein
MDSMLKCVKIPVFTPVIDRYAALAPTVPDAAWQRGQMSRDMITNLSSPDSALRCAFEASNSELVRLEDLFSGLCSLGCSLRSNGCSETVGLILQVSHADFGRFCGINICNLKYVIIKKRNKVGWHCMNVCGWGRSDCELFEDVN